MALGLDSRGLGSDGSKAILSSVSSLSPTYRALSLRTLRCRDGDA